MRTFYIHYAKRNHTSLDFKNDEDLYQEALAHDLWLAKQDCPETSDEYQRGYAYGHFCERKKIRDALQYLLLPFFGNNEEGRKGEKDGSFTAALHRPEEKEN